LKPRTLDTAREPISLVRGSRRLRPHISKRIFSARRHRISFHTAANKGATVDGGWGSYARGTLDLGLCTSLYKRILFHLPVEDSQRSKKV
jgi:hypothetical protein